VAWHDEAGSPHVAILRVSYAREGRVQAGVSAVRDPALLSVEDVLVPYLAVVGTHPGDVRTRVRLVAGIRGEDGRLGQHREVLLLLLLAPRQDQRHGGEVIRGQRRPHAGAAV